MSIRNWPRVAGLEFGQPERLDRETALLIDSVMTIVHCPRAGAPLTIAAPLPKQSPMIDSPGPWLTWTVVLVALGSTAGVIMRPQKSDTEVLLAVFCGSLALSMLRPLLDGQTSWLRWVAAIGGCATCNAN